MREEVMQTSVGLTPDIVVALRGVSRTYGQGHSAVAALRAITLDVAAGQRVAIARALATRAPLILADEPTGELDTATGRAIIDLLRAVVRSQHVTMLIAAHDPAVVAAADAAYHLSDGTLRLVE